MALTTFSDDSHHRRLCDAFRIQPLRAMRAIRRLIANREDTTQVFEIMRALSGRSALRGYMRMLDSDEGVRQAYLRDELSEKLQDRNWLARFEPGSVGAVYRDFMVEQGLSAGSLAKASRNAPEIEELRKLHPVAWYARRVRDIHDIWHVLTGYDTDALGEVCVVAFSYAQTNNFGFGFIALTGAIEFTRLLRHQPYLRAIRQAYAHGRRAAWLPAEDYEMLLSQPLDNVRRRLAIAQPGVYQGIPCEFRGPRRVNEIAEAA